MQVRKAVISTTVGLGMGAAIFAGAGAANASPTAGEPGAPGWSGGDTSVTVTKTVNKASLFNGNNLVSGNRIGVLNGTHVTLSVSILNGPILSNNILNSGANSFNTSVTNIKASNSFNTVTVTKDTIVTNNSGAPGKGGWEK